MDRRIAQFFYHVRIREVFGVVQDAFLEFCICFPSDWPALGVVDCPQVAPLQLGVRRFIGTPSRVRFPLPETLPKKATQSRKTVLHLHGVCTQVTGHEGPLK